MKLQTLEEVVSKNKIVLMDSSVLSNCFKRKGDLYSAKEEHRARIVLTDYLKKGLSFFITHSVFEESQATQPYPYESIIGRVTAQNRNASKLFKYIENSHKEIIELGRLFQKKDRVFNLNESEHNLYDVLHETYYGFLSSYGLSGVDFDFLLHGTVVSKTRHKSTALICNDTTGIYPAWQHIKRQENISPEQLGFFIRKKPDGFIVQK